MRLRCAVAARDAAGWLATTTNEGRLLEAGRASSGRSWGSGTS